MPNKAFIPLDLSPVNKITIIKNNERVKISILITTQELRADGIKVSVFKQIFKTNTWTSVKIDPIIAQKLERKILNKAGSLANSDS